MFHINSSHKLLKLLNTSYVQNVRMPIYPKNVQRGIISIWRKLLKHRYGYIVYNFPPLYQNPLSEPGGFWKSYILFHSVICHFIFINVKLSIWFYITGGSNAKDFTINLATSIPDHWMVPLLLDQDDREILCIP